MISDLSVALATHQRQEDEWIHYSGYTSPLAVNRTLNVDEVTCPSCKRNLLPQKKNK